MYTNFLISILQTAYFMKNYTKTTTTTTTTTTVRRYNAKVIIYINFKKQILKKQPALKIQYTPVISNSNEAKIKVRNNGSSK